jgi:thymidylate synthase
MSTSFCNEQGYLNLLSDVLENGEFRESRNGNVYSSFGKMITFENIHEQFPLLTSKKMFTKGIIEELLWFLSGSVDAKELQAKGVKIWDGNSSREYLDANGFKHYEEGTLGPIYGWQWRSFGKEYVIPGMEYGFDQIKYIIEELMKPDNSRRAVLSAWNPQQLSEMALPPCHILYTFYKDANGLSCLMTMRSSDLFLGLPFNIASTAFLTCIIAKLLHIHPKAISIVMTDAHIYEEHKDAVNEQLKNEILEKPKINIKREAPLLESKVEEKLEWISRLQYDDFEIVGYKSANAIKAPMK